MQPALWKKKGRSGRLSEWSASGSMRREEKEERREKSRQKISRNNRWLMTGWNFSRWTSLSCGGLSQRPYKSEGGVALFCLKKRKDTKGREERKASAACKKEKIVLMNRCWASLLFLPSCRPIAIAFFFFFFFFSFSIFLPDRTNKERRSQWDFPLGSIIFGWPP